MSTPPGVRVLLLDIEGTTTRIAFVHTTLFEYARAHLDRYLDSHSDSSEVLHIIGLLSDEQASEAPSAGAPPWRSDTPRDTLASVSAYAQWLMDRDRKSPGLKELQGLIWEEGYQAGSLRGEVFADVPRAFERWSNQGLEIAIYSSGSELAQRRLFGSTAGGDLTPYIGAFFDTRVGGKKEPASYQHIASALDTAPGAILFVSDVSGELAAAREAGCQTRLCARPGNPPQPDSQDFQQIATFDEL